MSPVAGGGNVAEELEEDPEIWSPEVACLEDPVIIEQARKRLPKLPKVKPSQFTEYAFRVPADKGVYENFSFKERRHLIRCYDTPARRVLLFCGRQVEKSTLLGNIALCYTCMIPAFKTLYVSPSAAQTKTFSNDRIKEPIETSPILKRFTTKMLSQNILEKQFVNRSKLTLRYAFLNADRARGIPAWMLEIDEFQDILSDNIPIIEQCLSHAPEQWKRFIYAGTPKSLDNILEYYRARYSTQGEWVVPCDRHGGDTGRYWNVLGEKNIGKLGLVCEKCKKLIDPMHKDSQWASMVNYDPIKVPFESYRIPQLMVPWKSWTEIVLDYERYPRDKFYNEVLGISFDSGMRPLTLAQVLDCCNPDLHMEDQEDVGFYRNLSFGQPVFCGLDWGSGEHSYTVITLATYANSKFRIFYMHRFVGEDMEPEAQLKKICELISYFNVRVIGCDYGGGFAMNDALIRKFGVQRVHKFQYLGRAKKKVEWDGRLRRWKVHRTEVMSDIFNAIKRKQVEFPRKEEFTDPYAQDMVNIFSEYSEQLRMVMYRHALDKPDDAFHSLLYCFVGSMIVQPRPDIIAPTKEDPRTGKIISTYSGPTYQG